METRPHWALVVLVAVALSALAMLVAILVRITVHQTPYFLFLPAVMVASWYGGRMGGLIATLTSILLLDYYVLVPQVLRCSPARGRTPSCSRSSASCR